MNDEQIAKLSKEIFKAVEFDLRDRRGLKHEWNMIDEHIQEEIRKENENSIAKIIKEQML